MGDFQAWWESQPKITKWLVVSTLAVTVLANFDFLNPYNLILLLPPIYQSFQIWRIGTCFLYYGKLGFPFLIDMVMLFQHSAQLEKDIFDGRIADYFYMLLLSSITLVITGLAFNFVILGHALIFVIIYYWSRKFPDRRTGLFMITFQGFYLPWALVAFHILLSGSIPMIEILGILVGHVYYFLSDLYPPGRNLVKTPAFLLNYFDPRDNRYARPTTPAWSARADQPPPAAPRGGYNWGRGQTLGSG